MKIYRCSDYGEMSRLCSDSIISILKGNRDSLLCTATGNSPLGVYKNLSLAYTNEPEVFGSLRIIKLDEWGGISLAEPNSCETFIREKILQPLHVAKERYTSFDSEPISPEKECDRIQQEIEKKGPIDICILGLGKNGHIGFNEPADVLIPNCHVAKLSTESLQHQMANGMETKPTYGLTLGMANILQSKKIVLLLTGSNKKTMIEKLLSKQITTYLPASFLWLHPHVECYIDMSVI